MKNKLFIICSIIISVFLVSNIVTFAYSNQTLFGFFFGNSNDNQKELVKVKDIFINDNQKELVKDILIKEDQKIVVDNYIVNLEESLCEKNTQLGYLVLSISDKNSNKVDAEIDNYNKTIKSFGTDKRFMFEYEATGTFNKYAEYKGNKLYVYISFEMNSEELSNIDASKCIKISDTKKNKQYYFKLKFSDSSRKFKTSNGMLYISPLGLRLATNNTIKKIEISLKDKSDKEIRNYSKNMLSEFGCKDNGITKVQYATQFENILNLKNIGHIYINGVELNEVK